jgi:hypothetical protein
MDSEAMSMDTDREALLHEIYQAREAHRLALGDAGGLLRGSAEDTARSIRTLLDRLWEQSRAEGAPCQPSTTGE